MMKNDLLRIDGSSILSKFELLTITAGGLLSPGNDEHVCPDSMPNPCGPDQLCYCPNDPNGPVCLNAFDPNVSPPCV